MPAKPPSRRGHFIPLSFKVFFDYDLVKLENADEFGLPQTMVSIAKKYPIKIVRTKNWIQINNYDDLAKAKKIVKNN